MNSPSRIGNQGSGKEAQGTRSQTAQAVADGLQEYGTHYVKEPAQDVLSILRDYAHDKPDVAAMWCFGLGVIVGWKLHR